MKATSTKCSGTNVEVPGGALLGAEGQAWEIARASLSLERVGIPRFALATKMLHRAVARLERAGRFGHGAIEQAAKARAACEAARFYSYGIVDQREHGIPTGPEASAARFATVMAERAVHEFVIEHVPEALSGGESMLLAHHQRAIVAGIASGAAEIQLNLIATELLKAAAGAALMDFRLTADQSALVEAIDKLAAQFEAKPTEFRGFVLPGHELEKELTDAQYFDIVQVPELGALCAAMAVERLARLPYATETALSMLVRPQLAGEWPRPWAVVENGRPGRFAAAASTLLVIEGDDIGIVRTAATDVEPVESLFAYPMGRWKGGANTSPLSADDAANVRKWLRIRACGRRRAGSCRARSPRRSTISLSASSSDGRSARSRRCVIAWRSAPVLAGGVRWLALKAADTADPGDAALAALHAQESATRVIYDVHQMLGAMGMTLEHPLHLWTYRLKALLSDLGGRGGQALAVAEECFRG